MSARKKRQTPTRSSAASLFNQIRCRTRTPQFMAYLKRLLVELCRVDTTPNSEVGRMREAESHCFEVIERELGKLRLPGLDLERRPINPEIKRHPHFSLLHFTKTQKNPEGLSAEATYEGRSNLLCRIPGASAKGPQGKALALNAHVDVVAPYFPPRAAGGTIFSRGACDDKGPLVSIIGALKVLGETLAEAGLQPNRGILGMFVVEEETGGNGSLSLAIDRKLREEYDSVLVGECTGLKIHPANRGAVWYRAELAPPAGVSAFEMFAFVNEAMEKEGAALRAESHHPLFPQRPVQTCHGILGPFGEHPSRICGEVQFRIIFGGNLHTEVKQLAQDCLRSGLAAYVGAYGDKTQALDPATGRPMVKRHYTITKVANTLEVTVFGATGHMGAIRERDGAITKTAHLVRSLVLSRARLESISGGVMRLELAGTKISQPLILEGGQGFVPTHDMEEVMKRMQQAATLGAEAYLARAGQGANRQTPVRLTYEKLHNVAFDGDPYSVTMRNALAAARACGLPEQEPVLGWTVSCDARLFAKEYPGLEVLTFGPGRLADAHSDREQVELADVRIAAEFLADFILRQTGIPAEPPTPKK